MVRPLNKLNKKNKLPIREITKTSTKNTQLKFNLSFEQKNISIEKQLSVGFGVKQIRVLSAPSHY